MLDGTIGDEQLSELDRRLQETPESLDLYCNLMMNHAALRPRGRTPIPLDGSVPTGSEYPQDLLEGLAAIGSTSTDRKPLELDEEGLREAIDYDEQIAAQLTAKQARKQAAARKEAIRKAAQEIFERFKEEERRRQEELAYKLYLSKQRRLVFGIGSLASMLVIVACAWLFGLKPQAPIVPRLPGPVAPAIVAQIARSINAQWSHEGFSTAPGTPLTPSSMFLTQGLLELAFDDGAGSFFRHQSPCNWRVMTKCSSAGGCLGQGHRGFHRLHPPHAHGHSR